MRYGILCSMAVLIVMTSLNVSMAESEQSGTNGSPSKWGAGTSLTYPIASICMVQLSYSAWSMGDLLTGYAYQYWRDAQGRSRAQTVLVGYRQFIWRGLHMEVELWPAYNPFKSSVDGKTYRGLELWMSVRAGYRFDFEIYGRELFILPQPSIGFGVARQNGWPGMKRGFNPIFEPQLIVGTRF